jgi:hypothetical protein
MHLCPIVANDRKQPSRTTQNARRKRTPFEGNELVEIAAFTFTLPTLIADDSAHEGARVARSVDEYSCNRKGDSP